MPANWLLAEACQGRGPQCGSRSGASRSRVAFDTCSGGVTNAETIVTPVHAPNANAVAERVIGTLRRECLDHVIVLNEQHLLRVLHEYVDHYNEMRPHRSLALDSPDGRPPQPMPESAQIISRPVLGGLHHFPRTGAGDTRGNGGRAARG